MAEKLKVELWDRNTLTKILYRSYNFDLSHLDFIEHSNNENKFDEEQDPFLFDIIEKVIETGQTSASYIQRNFKVGYARACNLIDQLEARGIISSFHGSKPRNVLITKEKWEQIKNKFNKKY